MNSIVLYFYPNKPGHRNTLQDSSLCVGKNKVGFVRAELHMNKDAAHALDDAKPHKNETVLNSVELE